MESEKKYMSYALAEAVAAAGRGEVPVGAVLVDTTTGDIIAASGNDVISASDPTGHAEMRVLRQAARQLGAPRLVDCDLYVTLEPCPMCAGALSLARVRRIYFGAYDPKGGGVEHGPRVFSHPTCHHRPEVYGGIDEDACGQILRDFFQARRGMEMDA